MGDSGPSKFLKRLLEPFLRGFFGKEWGRWALLHSGCLVILDLDGEELLVLDNLGFVARS